MSEPQGNKMGPLKPIEIFEICWEMCGKETTVTDLWTAVKDLWDAVPLI